MRIAPRRRVGGGEDGSVSERGGRRGGREDVSLVSGLGAQYD